MGDLRERMRQAMVALGWPESTREAYLGWGYDLAKHYMRSPELLSGDEVQRYVSHLCLERQLEPASVQTAGAALRFLYENVLGRPRFELPGHDAALSPAAGVAAAAAKGAAATTHPAVMKRVVTAVAMVAAQPESAKGVLRERMRQAMVLRGLAVRTREAYLAWGHDLARYYKRSPETLDEAEVRRYMLYLIEERKLANATVRQAVGALRFLYEVVLRRQRGQFEIPQPKREQKLPEILSRTEVARIMAAAGGLRARMLLMLTYGGGLRVSDTVNLRVEDLDFERGLVRVVGGKGKKDRYTLLAKRCVPMLHEYVETVGGSGLLFVRQDGKAMERDTALRVYMRAKDRAGVKKGGGIHGLRHAFATHLLEAGCDPVTIQRMMGHRNIQTTLRYLHVTQARVRTQVSPADLLPDLAEPQKPGPRTPKR